MNNCIKCSLSLNLFCVDGKSHFISLEYCCSCCFIFVKCTQCNLCRKKFYKNGRDFLKVHVKFHQSNLPSSEEQDVDTIEWYTTSVNNVIVSMDIFGVFLSNKVNFGRNECLQYILLLIKNDSESLNKVMNTSLSSHYCTLSKTMDESSKHFNNIFQLH